MRSTHRPALVFAAASLALLSAATALIPTTASAQTGPERAWAVVPLLGGGRVVEDGDWRSAGAEAALELEYGGTGWRGSGYGSVRGLGMGCSEACFDGGPAFAAGVARALGPLWLGGGGGVMKDRDEWHPLAYGRASVPAGRFRIDVRIELPQDHVSDVYVPILVGIPLPRRMR